jgi:hypothetical protein
VDRLDAGSSGGGGSNDTTSPDDGGGGQDLANCGYYTRCFEQEIDSDGDFVFDTRTWACYTYDPSNGNRLTGYIDYYNGFHVVQKSESISYTYHGNVLTVVCETDTNADRQADITEHYTWDLDAQGNRIRGEIEIDNDGDGFTDEQRLETLTYDAHGEISTWDVVVDIKPFGSPDSSSARTFTRAYDADGKITELVIAFNPDGDNDIDAYHKFTYTYDADGVSCDIGYDNDASGSFEVRATSLCTKDDNGDETEEGERYGGPNNAVDYTWANSWKYAEICSSGLSTPLSKPLDPLYVLK